MNYDHAYELIMDNVNGASFMGIDTETEVKLTGGKKNPMQGRVTKQTVGSTVMVFANTDQSAYVNMVKKRMMQEGKDADEFEVKPRAWGERIDRTPFVAHKGGHYLECFFMSAGKSSYFLDGKFIEKDDIEGLPVAAAVNEDSQGGIENKVVIRTYNVESITAMRLQGVEMYSK
jgi:hypothetical protein